jgi:hypothetical protein
VLAHATDQLGFLVGGKHRGTFLVGHGWRLRSDVEMGQRTPHWANVQIGEHCIVADVDSEGMWSLQRTALGVRLPQTDRIELSNVRFGHALVMLGKL